MHQRQVRLRSEYRILHNCERTATFDFSVFYGCEADHVVMEPKDRDNVAVIMEFKVFDKEDHENGLEDTARNALRQIEDKQYAADFLQRGIPEDRILKYGFAFAGETEDRRLNWYCDCWNRSIIEVKKETGTNIQDVKLKNRMLIIKLVATGTANTRIEIAKAMGLSKMAVTNIVQELLAQDILEESAAAGGERTTSGRPPILLRISEKSPRIGGMLIKRGLVQVVLSDLSGKVIRTITEKYDGRKIDAESLIELLKSLYEQLIVGEKKQLLAVGVSSVGPVDTKAGLILNPPDFYGIENLNIVEKVKDFVHAPVYLINDANAGALAENLYGSCKQVHDFVYLHIMNGNGTGLVLKGELYNGEYGKSGELGHTSINFAGPKCNCGNKGCLDLYANLEHMIQKSKALLPLYPDSMIAKLSNPCWEDFIEAADLGDALAKIALIDFCGYISVAVENLLNFLDISKVVVGYNSYRPSCAVEDILTSQISGASFASKEREVTFSHSYFGGDAPLIGSIAVVANKVFSLALSL